MAGASDQEFVPGVPVDLAPEKVEAELGAMWSGRGGEGEATGAARITLSNVVWLGSSRRARRAREVFARLAPLHPCRLFLLECVPGEGTEDLEAFVNAYCFKKPGMEREICCEEIHARFGERGLAMVPGAVLPLLVPDVPTIFWSYSAEPERYGTAVQAIERAVDLTIHEAAFMQDPAAGLRSAAESNRRVIDLSMAATMPLREQVATAADDVACARLLGNIDTINIGWKGRPDDREALVHASLIAGWLASRLGWENPGGSPWPYYYNAPGGRVNVRFSCRQAGGTRQGDIVYFGAENRDGDSLELVVASEEAKVRRIVSGPSRGCDCAPRTIHGGILDAGDALGLALNAQVDVGNFGPAAARAWPLLAAALEKGRTAG